VIESMTTAGNCARTNRTQSSGDRSLALTAGLSASKLDAVSARMAAIPGAKWCQNQPLDMTPFDGIIAAIWRLVKQLTDSRSSVTRRRAVSRNDGHYLVRLAACAATVWHMFGTIISYIIDNQR